MTNFILRESDWEEFIQKEIFSIIKKDKTTIFALVGDLGSGKTTFSKVFLKELGLKQHIQSPTFSIINSYILNSSKKVFHIDVYRIEQKNELDVLRVDEIFLNQNAIIIIEWADKIRERIPSFAHWIYFEHDTMETRKISMEVN